MFVSHQVSVENLEDALSLKQKSSEVRTGSSNDFNMLMENRITYRISEMTTSSILKIAFVNHLEVNQRE